MNEKNESNGADERNAFDQLRSEFEDLKKQVLEELHPKVTKHRQRIDEHGNRIDEHGNRIDEHGNRIDEHGNRIDEHKNQLGEHSQTIDSHQGHLDDHHEKIQNIQGKIHGHEFLTPIEQQELKTFIPAWRGRKFIQAVLAGIIVVLFGSSGGVALWALSSVREKGREEVANIEKKFEEARRVVEARFDDALEKIDEEVNLIVRDEFMRKRATEAAIERFYDDFQFELSSNDFANVTALLVNVKTQLYLYQTSAWRQAERWGQHLRVDPLLVQTLLYAIDGLLETYRGPTLAGRLEPKQRSALILVANGIMKQALGQDDKAREWFEIACRHDPTFPESKVFLARLLGQKIRYNGKRSKHPWPGAHEDRLQAILLLNDAIGIEGDPLETDDPKKIAQWLRRIQRSADQPLNIEVKRSIPLLARLCGRFKLADQLAQNLIDEEKRRWSWPDPRLYYIKGLAIWEGGFDIQSPRELVVCRKQAVEAMVEALKIDPRYLIALNNYIWMTSHYPGGAMPFVGSLGVDNDCLDDDEKAELQTHLKQLQSYPFVKRTPDTLNTLAEAYLVLGQFDEAERFGDDSVQVAKEMVYPLIYQDLLGKRRELVVEEITRRRTQVEVDPNKIAP